MLHRLKINMLKRKDSLKGTLMKSLKLIAEPIFPTSPEKINDLANAIRNNTLERIDWLKGPLMKTLDLSLK
jgi:hypothetical protein